MIVIRADGTVGRLINMWLRAGLVKTAKYQCLERKKVVFKLKETREGGNNCHD